MITLTELFKRSSVFITIYFVALLMESSKVAPPSPSSFIASSIPTPIFKLFTAAALFITVHFGDKKEVWPYTLPYIVPILTWYYANWGIYHSIIVAVFVIVPIIEVMTLKDPENLTEEEEKELNSRESFRFVTMFWVPVQLALLCWACWAVSVWNLDTISFILFSISIGFNTGVLGINISHELIHKNSKLEVFLGKVLLVTVCYGHWYLEHIYGHHKNVSTPDDPATSHYGENFYHFWVKSVWGGFWSAWDIAENRKKKNKADPNITKFFGNEVIFLSCLSLLIAIFIGFTWGRKSVLLFLLQSITAFSLLEIINYIEHYGLERRKDDKGYELVTPIHSWNADTKVTNLVLFKLQRHSDHHAYAARRYQILRSFREAPQMPTGYAGMLVIALIPPLWFSLMNKKAKEFYNKASPK